LANGAAMKKALISGASGQDASYLAELLLSKGYEVHGTKRRSSSFNTQRIDHLVPDERFHLHYMDVTDALSVSQVMQQVAPDEIYHLAAQSHVGVSFEMPGYTFDSIAQCTLNMLEAMRRFAPEARFYQASSSEMFGNQPAPQSETTPFAPVSPYACAKVAAHHLACTYREAYKLHVSCGILFNHESPRRGETFVTRKIAMGLARIKAGLQHKLVLGNLDARRDWGYAPEYCDAMWRMLQQDRPDDYVIGTGASIKVEAWLDMCLVLAGLSRTVIELDDRYSRPVEVNNLRVHSVKAYTVLGWEPRTYAASLARIMMEAEIEACRSSSQPTSQPL
jgi:GDPmannose 4,6-dehydratase